MKRARRSLSSIPAWLGTWVAALCLAAGSIAVLAAPPAWWQERGVLRMDNQGAIMEADDYAAVNQGQLKMMALAAFNECEARMPGGAGAAVSSLIGEWTFVDGNGNRVPKITVATDDFAVVNLGQLKWVAKPFYDRLIPFGFSLPWTGSADDFALANLGQLKNVFAFDLGNLRNDDDTDTLSDAWELYHFGTTAAFGPTDDPDRDGLTNEQEYLAGSDPTDCFNGSMPVIQMISGNNQREEPGIPLMEPLVVLVTDQNGQPLIDAPIDFSSTAAGLYESDASLALPSLSVRTDASGFASARAISPSSKGDFQVHARANIGKRRGTPSSGASSGGSSSGAASSGGSSSGGGSSGGNSSGGSSSGGASSGAASSGGAASAGSASPGVSFNGTSGPPPETSRHVFTASQHKWLSYWTGERYSQNMWVDFYWVLETVPPTPGTGPLSDDFNGDADLKENMFDPGDPRDDLVGIPANPGGFFLRAALPGDTGIFVMETLMPDFQSPSRLVETYSWNNHEIRRPAGNLEFDRSGFDPVYAADLLHATPYAGWEGDGQKGLIEKSAGAGGSYNSANSLDWTEVRIQTNFKAAEPITRLFAVRKVAYSGGPPQETLLGIVSLTIPTDGLYSTTAVGSSPAVNALISGGTIVLEPSQVTGGATVSLIATPIPTEIKVVSYLNKPPGALIAKASAVCVGERIALSISVPGFVTGYSWRVPGGIGSYSATAAAAHVTNLSAADTNANAVTFYYPIAGNGAGPVYCDLTLAAGGIVTIKGSLTVVAPTFSVKATFRDPAVGIFAKSVTWIHLGDYRFSTLGGFTFVRNDFKSPSGFSAEKIEWWQTVDATVNGTGVYKATSGLDSKFPYSDLWQDTDSPFSVVYPKYSPVTRSDSFTMYLMFKPAVPGSIFVPLKQIDWWWGITAAYEKHGNLDPRWYPIGIPYSNGIESLPAAEPEWNHFATKEELNLTP